MTKGLPHLVEMQKKWNRDKFQSISVSLDLGVNFEDDLENAKTAETQAKKKLTKAKTIYEFFFVCFVSSWPRNYRGASTPPIKSPS